LVTARPTSALTKGREVVHPTQRIKAMMDDAKGRMTVNDNAM